MKLSRKFSRIICILAVITVLFGSIGISEDSSGIYVAQSNYNRIAGTNRYKTSREAVKEYRRLKNGALIETLIVASGDSFADAMGGSYLSKVADAPILLVSDGVIRDTVSFVNSNVSKAGKIYILGSEAAVSAKVENALKTAGYRNISRLSGTNRYKTNLAVLEEADAVYREKNPGKAMDEKILIASGEDFPDALSGGATGHPVLLVNRSRTEEQKKYIINAHKKTIYILGGESAVTSTVSSWLSAKGLVKRLAGKTRYETSIEIAKEFCGSSPKEVVVAWANDFPDALSAVSIAQHLNAPVVLSSVSNIGAAYNYTKKANTKAAWVLGGVSGVPDKAVFTAGGGLDAGWNMMGSNYVYVNKSGYVEVKAFKIGSVQYTPTSGGIIPFPQRYNFQWPVEGPLTSFFGYRSAASTNYIGSTNHQGLDIGVKSYTAVKAALDGTVIHPTSMGWNTGYGNVVYIQHSDGLVTLYAHNASINVKVGQKVKQGQIIALSGSTGNSTGPHVHFEVRRNGTPQDPLLYLPANKYYKP